MTMPPYKAPELPDGWRDYGLTVASTAEAPVSVFPAADQLCVQQLGGPVLQVPMDVVRYLCPADHRKVYDATARADELAHKCQVALLEKAQHEGQLKEANELLDSAAVMIAQFVPDDMREAFAEAFGTYVRMWGVK